MSHGVGRRIHVLGNSAAGKSTLGAKLAEVLEVPIVELDALNWLPGWVGLNQTDPAELDRRIRHATAGDGFVVAGSYESFSRPAFWSRLDTVVWIDLPVWQLLTRVLKRSWRRWRTGELLWGTNREQFWPQLAIWRGDDSLVWWIVTQQQRKQRQMRAAVADPRWSHIRFVHLRSSEEVALFVRAVDAMC